MKKTIFISVLILSFDALAVCNEVGYFDCGTTGDVKWYVSNDQKTLSFSGNGAMDNYEQTKIFDDNGKEIANITTAPWKDYTYQIENIVIAEGVTSIGDHAFATFENTKNVSLPNTLETIGIKSFRNTDSLLEVELPSSLVSIGSGAFLSGGLTKLVIPDGVESIGDNAFYNAKYLESLVIPASVTEIGKNVFGKGKNLNLIGTFYCEQPSTGTSPCNSGLGVSQDRFKYYTKDQNGNIIVNGQKYSSLEKLAKGVEVKRIYTVEEASKLSKPTGNTFKLRYK
ncbi:MAG: leucine-rich repeat domain-containing protein [Alphaproteobacteria bacterium]|nr:leucine-rich repeat domain-containing protein [Alphaproteobacteria bacterium]